MMVVFVIVLAVTFDMQIVNFFFFHKGVFVSLRNQRFFSFEKNTN